MRPSSKTKRDKKFKKNPDELDLLNDQIKKIMKNKIGTPIGRRTERIGQEVANTMRTWISEILEAGMQQHRTSIDNVNVTLEDGQPMISFTYMPDEPVGRITMECSVSETDDEEVEDTSQASQERE